MDFGPGSSLPALIVPLNLTPWLICAATALAGAVAQLARWLYRIDRRVCVMEVNLAEVLRVVRAADAD